MQFIVCLLFATFRLGSANTASQRLTLGAIPAQTFGTQVDTEYDESLPVTREVSEADSDGLTLGITIGTQPMTLRRFGTQKIVMTDVPLKRFGAQVDLPSAVLPEEPLTDGVQTWGSQDSSEASQLPIEPAFDNKLQHFGSQGLEVSNIPVEPRVEPDQQPITMAEAMAPHSKVGHEQAQPSIVLSEAPLRHSWNDRIVVSEVPVSHFGKGDAVADLDLSWHLAWQPRPADSTGALRASNGGRAGRSKSGDAQEQMAVESDNEKEILPSFEPIVEVWRYCAFAMCIACLAMHMCRSQQLEATKPLLAA